MYEIPHLKSNKMQVFIHGKVAAIDLHFGFDDRRVQTTIIWSTLPGRGHCSGFQGMQQAGVNCITYSKAESAGHHSAVEFGQ